MEIQLYGNPNRVSGLRVSRKVKWSKAFPRNLKSSTASAWLVLPSWRLLVSKLMIYANRWLTWALASRHVLPTKERFPLSVYKSLTVLTILSLITVLLPTLEVTNILFLKHLCFYHMDKWKIVFTKIHNWDCAYSKPNGKLGFKTFYHREVEMMQLFDKEEGTHWISICRLWEFTALSYDGTLTCVPNITGLQGDCWSAPCQTLHT